MKRSTTFRSLLLAAALFLTASPAMLHAQASATLTTLHALGDSNGSIPYAALVQGSDGNFYGTTYQGGAHGHGMVYKITSDGTPTTLYSFSGGSDGSTPYAGLVQGSDSNFYGTTYSGGTNLGTVFRITPAGVLTTLYTFGSNDGAGPAAALVRGSDGNFYGTTVQGGTAGVGTVFRITPAGVLTTLHSFSGSDGREPGGLVQGSDGNFYGATTAATATDPGTVFQITPAGVLTTIHRFSGSDGQGPNGLVQGSDGNFYGTTNAGGASDVSGSQSGYGTVFQMTRTGTLTTLHSFSGSDGAYPSVGLVQGSDGNFYGTTGFGGASFVPNGQLGDGTVFQITPAGALTTLYSFSGSGAVGPSGLVQGSDGNFYGSTAASGNNDGTVFRLSIAGVLPHPTFFTGEMALSNGVYYLAFASGNPFGYYSFLSDPHYLYHFDLGYEYVFDAADGKAGVYLYDFASGSFFYTSPTFPFPYLYDFGLNTVLYYYPDPNNPGRYNTNGYRFFYRFDTGQIITK